MKIDNDFCYLLLIDTNNLLSICIILVYMIKGIKLRLLELLFYFGFSITIQIFFLFYSKLTFIFLLLPFIWSLPIYSSQMFLPSSCPPVHSSNLYSVWLFVPFRYCDFSIHLPARHCQCSYFGVLALFSFPSPLVLNHCCCWVWISRFLNGISFQLV